MRSEKKTLIAFNIPNEMHSKTNIFVLRQNEKKNVLNKNSKTQGNILVKHQNNLIVFRLTVKKKIGTLVEFVAFVIL